MEERHENEAKGNRKKSQEHRRGGERKANAGGEGKRKHEREKKKRKANA